MSNIHKRLSLITLQAINFFILRIFIFIFVFINVFFWYMLFKNLFNNTGISIFSKNFFYFFLFLLIILTNCDWAFLYCWLTLIVIILLLITFFKLLLLVFFIKNISFHFNIIFVYFFLYSRLICWHICFWDKWLISSFCINLNLFWFWRRFLYLLLNDFRNSLIVIHTWILLNWV